MKANRQASAASVTPLFRDILGKQRLPAIGIPTQSKQALISGFVGLLATAVLGVCALVVFGSYTRKAHVTGYIVPDKGIIKLMPPRESRIAQRFVEEGAAVAEDALLFVLDVSGVTSAGRTGQQLAEQLGLRRDLLRAELERLPAIQTAEAQRLEAEIASLRGQLEGAAREIAARAAYLALADQALGRARQLEGQAIYSVLQREKAEVDRMTGAAQLASLERFQSGLRGDLEKNLADWRGQRDRQANERSRLARSLGEVEQQMIQAEEQSFLQIRAPAAGTVTRVTANLGAAVDGAAPIATILPVGAVLEANLYAPSKAAGFLRVGGRVLLRYEAYPYQKFGLQEAVIVSVSKTAVNTKELPFPIASEEPLYLITARLAKQSIIAYGKEEPLQPGARLSADVMLEERRIWEWILEPLIAMQQRG